MDADRVGDLGDGVLALAVGPFGLVHAAHRRRLAGGELGFPAAPPAAGPGRRQTLAGSLDDQLALELVDRAEDVEDEPALRGAGVDALLEYHQVDVAPLQFVFELEEVFSERIDRERQVMTNVSPSRR